ncbi:MAG: glycosyltransferase family 4 protein [Chloroflexota bacterium]|nr:glycosyltransferase family 4 protein [Chloroflexota bacterium]
MVDLDKQLLALGHDSRILAPAGSEHGLARNVTSLGQSIQTLNISGSKARISLSPLVAIRLRRALRQEAFDVVHLHEPLIPIACLAALLSSTAPMIGTIHGYRDRSALYEFTRPLLGRWIRRLSARTAVSQDALRWAAQYFPGDYTIISDGVDIARFEAWPRVTPTDPTVLYVGRLDERKGFPFLLDAFERVRAQIPSARLTVAGAYSDLERATWEKVLSERRIGGVSFIGRVADDDLPRVYRGATVFCAPSTGFEALGIVLLEALASGLPVVTTNIEGYRTVVRPDVDALVVPPRDTKALASAIERLMRDRAARDALSASGRARVALYDWPVLARQYVSLYERVMHARGLANGGTPRA